MASKGNEKKTIEKRKAINISRRKLVDGGISFKSFNWIIQFSHSRIKMESFFVIYSWYIYRERAEQSRVIRSQKAWKRMKMRNLISKPQNEYESHPFMSSLLSIFFSVCSVGMFTVSVLTLMWTFAHICRIVHVKMRIVLDI